MDSTGSTSVAESGDDRLPDDTPSAAIDEAIETQMDEDEDDHEDKDTDHSNLFKSGKKLDPQRLEKYFLDQDRITKTALQKTAKRMHESIDSVVTILDRYRRAKLEANLKTCHTLIEDIQKMESEHERMENQISEFVNMVKQAHVQVFKSTEKKE